MTLEYRRQEKIVKDALQDIEPVAYCAELKNMLADDRVKKTYLWTLVATLLLQFPSAQVMKNFQLQATRSSGSSSFLLLGQNYRMSNQRFSS